MTDFQPYTTLIEDSGYSMVCKLEVLKGIATTNKRDDLLKSTPHGNIHNNFFSLSQDLIGIMGTDGCLQYVNPFWKKILGFSEEEILFKSILELIHPDDQEKTIKAMKRLSEGNPQTGFINRLLCKEGAYELIEWNITPDAQEASLYCIGRKVSALKLSNTSPADNVYLATLTKDTAKQKGFEGDSKTHKVLYRTLYENSPYGIVIAKMLKDEKSNYIDFIHLEVNPATKAVTGFDPSQLIHKKASEIIDPKMLKELVALYSSTVLSGEPVSFIKYFSLYDRTLKVTVFSLQDDIFVINYINVSQRLEAEKKLKRSENLFRLLAENAKDMIYRMSIPEAVYQYVSPSSLQVFGYSPHEFYVTPFLIEKVIHPDWRGYLKREWQNLLEGNVSPYFEYPIIHKNGSLRWMNQRNTLIKEINGNPIAIEAVVTDITERKKVEEKLRENQKRYQKAQVMGEVGNWEYSPVTNEFWGSDQAKRIYGFDTENEDFSADLVEGCIPDRERVHQALVNLITMDQKYDLIFDIITYRTGIHKTIHSIAETERDNLGKVIKITGVISDITKQKKSEDRQIASLKEKEILIRELYHRTKNNMQIISAMLHLRGRFLNNLKITGVFNEIENSIHSMALLHQKLYESKDLSHLNLKEYIKDIVQILKKNLFASSNKIEFSVEGSEIEVLLDTAMPIGLAVNEIITNSIKYAFPDHRKGRIDIQVLISSQKEIFISISDNGIGLPENFDLEKGKGYGMQIIFDLIEHQLHGSIVMESLNGVSYRIVIPEELYKARI